MQIKKLSKKEISGISLLELLVVISIIAIASGSSIYSLRSFRGHSHLRIALSLLIADFKQALARSVAYRETLTLTLSKKSYGFLSSRPNGSRTYKKNRTLPPHISIEGPSKISFFPSGVVSPSTIYLRHAENGHCALTVSLRGRAKSRCTF